MVESKRVRFSSYPKCNASCAVKKSVDNIGGLSSSMPQAFMKLIAASTRAANSRYSRPRSRSSMKSRFHFETRCMLA